MINFERTRSEGGHFMEDRRIAKTKGALREAFVCLLRTKSLNDITVAELCRVANVDRRTFYNHYNNVGEIIDEIDGIAISILSDAIKDIPIHTKEFFDQFTKIMLTNMDYYEVIVREDRSFAVLEARCKKILSRGLVEYYSKHSSVDPLHLEYMAEYCASGIMSVYTHWIRTGRKLPVEELSQMAFSLTIVDWDEFDVKYLTK